MDNRTVVVFNKKPSDFFTLWQAFRSRKGRYNGESVPEILTVRPDFSVSPAHLRKFNQICDISPTPHLHMLYPFTMVYPYLMRILCREEMPFSQFSVLNTRNRIVMHRQISPDEKFMIECRFLEMKNVSKGYEFDFNAAVYCGNEKVWENTATYFSAAKSVSGDGRSLPFRLELLEEGELVKEYWLAAKKRYSFGRVSGDTNGIHYSAPYARMFGFRRDFAQPIRVVAWCMSNLPDVKPDMPGELDFLLKGPVYYESKILLWNRSKAGSRRFDLYCSNNERPCISGKLEPLC